MTGDLEETYPVLEGYLSNSTLRGIPAEFRADGMVLQWKYLDEETWKNLINLDYIDYEELSRAAMEVVEADVNEMKVELQNVSDRQVHIRASLADISDALGRIVNTLQGITTATLQDVGKYLVVKAVENGVVTEWEFVDPIPYPAAITVIEPPEQTLYKVGDTFNAEGMRVQVEWSNGVTRELRDDEYTVDDSPFTIPGNKIGVTITCTSIEPYTLTTEFEVNVEDININLWQNRALVSRLGVARRYFEVGDIIPSTYTVDGTEYDNPWRVVGFRTVETSDGTVYTHVPIIEMVYKTHEKIVFDAPELNEATESTAQSGVYYCGCNDNSYTMLNLETGDSIPYNDYTTVYKTPWNNVNAVKNGVANWKLSYLRQYLNNTGTGWAAKSYAFDVLPDGAADQAGFMTYLPADMIEVLHPVKVTTGILNYMGGGVDETYDVFWPLSVSEINSNHSSAMAEEGIPLDYYIEGGVKDYREDYDVYGKYPVDDNANDGKLTELSWRRTAVRGAFAEISVGTRPNTSLPKLELAVAPACAII